MMCCTIQVAKTKALISFAVITKLIRAFVFACAKIRFSHNEPQFTGENIVFLSLLWGKGSCKLVLNQNQEENFSPLVYNLRKEEDGLVVELCMTCSMDLLH